MMTYQQYAPPSVLKRYVRYFWSFDVVQHPQAALHIKSFADKYPRLIFQDLNGFEPLRDLDGMAMPMCYVSGIDTRQTGSVMLGSFSHFGVSFFPHALASFLADAPRDLLNSTPHIELLSTSTVHAALDQAKNHLERVQLVSKFLMDNMTASEHDLLIDELIHSHGGDDEISMAALQKIYRVSERSLQRRFKAAVGISHKKYQRILRFEKSLDLLKDASYRALTTIAHQLKYTDQSHFIKDFTAFAGISPYTFVRNKSIGSESSSFIYAGSGDR
jgi:AraC-like DNA-binding protein